MNSLHDSSLHPRTQITGRTRKIRPQSGGNSIVFKAAPLRTRQSTAKLILSAVAQHPVASISVSDQQGGAFARPRSRQRGEIRPVSPGICTSNRIQVGSLASVLAVQSA